MAGEDLVTYSGQAAIAYKDALNQANAMKNSLFRQFGFVAPNASGEYSTEAAQGAFDPNVLFKDGQLDQNELRRLAGSLSMGGSGMLADITRKGASDEADIVAEARSRGFGGDIGGGLLNQRRALAESQTSGNLTGAKNQFISSLGDAFSPISGAYQNIEIAKAQDKYAQESAAAMKNGLSSSVDLNAAMNAPAAGKVKPTERGTRMYELRNGYRWMGAKGWQPVKS